MGSGTVIAALIIWRAIDFASNAVWTYKLRPERATFLETIRSESVLALVIDLAGFAVGFPLLMSASTLPMILAATSILILSRLIAFRVQCLTARLAEPPDAMDSR